jgi:branched-chain amino acid transport system permease protein
LAALNDSEAGCASIGMSTTVTKVIAFTLAAGIAGLGGALYGGMQRDVGPNDFQMLVSLILLLTITLGGIDTVGGAFAAAMFYALQPVIQRNIHIPEITFLLVGLGAVGLGRNPGGIVGQLFGAVDHLRLLGNRIREAREPSPDFGLFEPALEPLPGPAVALEPGPGRDRVAVH